ncbi:MAG: hypothetical protein M0Z30_21700 [Actinomycetota bacterium]|nr:hypothetical protein [Actinomycetota bacterium]
MAHEADTESMQAPVGASVWEDELFSHIRAHMERERGVLEEYQAAAQEAGSEAFSYLVGILCDDERRHHEFFRTLAETLKADAECSGAAPAIPHMDFGRRDMGRVRRLTEQLRQSERDDAEELKRLHRMLRDVRDTTLWDVIVTLMRNDTEKHIALLDFVLDHTRTGLLRGGR